MGGTRSTYGGTEEMCTEFLVGIGEGKRALGRHGRRWENNTENYLKDIGGRIWIGLICLRTGRSGVLLWKR